MKIYLLPKEGLCRSFGNWDISGIQPIDRESSIISAASRLRSSLFRPRRPGRTDPAIEKRSVLDLLKPALEHLALGDGERLTEAAFQTARFAGQPLGKGRGRDSF
jgi:hypothetical protein